ncbi:hypothetical protein D6D01_01178 [Aureobasidium pullulans]|uniref:Inhibitor I9 domain-containing protein n=1 Tax=Aureobasidium pullulans TaxID=5580 RepID=A0A4S9LZV3_AURPU|nr:hypothetical protein D6D01_01178 [Aureobasidium pullulans]
MPRSSTRKSAHTQVQRTCIDHGSAKKQVTEQGGKITTEFKLIKGFTAEFPEDKVHTLSSNDHINVENDGEVRTQ